MCVSPLAHKHDKNWITWVMLQNAKIGVLSTWPACAENLAEKRKKGAYAAVRRCGVCITIQLLRYYLCCA